ncbi:hypothetical protein HUN08_12290 [Gordonia sp. X0973]|uniref:hypothetical protein n=1 Tax=Gordonia sp. X0973 TaxID=2742602 RepID=UPI000F53F7E5|nr:hypothetical protein [Gordonia sp. X0973]QKT07875.1 hypothetical protein HUN08_12290 [Gordonia sp. X0973]
MPGKFSRAASTVVVGMAATALVAGSTAAFAAPPRPAPAPPAAVPQLPKPNPGGTSTLPIQVPFDSQLAAALKFAKQLGGDKLLVEVIQAMMGVAGQLSPVPVPGTKTTAAPEPGVKFVDAATDPLSLLRSAGVQPLSPAVSPMCTAPTPENPLGLVTAGAAAIPGPWPLRSGHPLLAPLANLPFPLPGIQVPDPNIVKDEQTAFAFIPPDTEVGGKKGTMRVAWLNTSSLKGGITELAPLADTNPVLKALPGLSGVRLTPVDTGKGTVLAAVYGTAGVGGRECFFLPAVGVINS